MHSAIILKGLYFVIMDKKYVLYHGVREALAGHYTALHIDFSLFPHAVQDNKLARSGHILSGGPPAARKQRKEPRRKGQ